jgi:hypothetical protein
VSKLLRHVNPLGYVDVPLIGREGPAPYLVCHAPEECHDEHEHTEMIVEPGADQPGVGCLIPGEVFEVSDEHAAILLDQIGNYALAEPVKKRTPVKKAAKKAAPMPLAEPGSADVTSTKEG